MSKRVAVLVGIAAVLCTLLAGPTASATQGSVPGEVSTYAAASDGMIKRLNDVFGVGARGKGIDFDETTKSGPLSRVFLWTDEFLAGEETETPVRRINQWVSAILINDKPVGVATIWINDVTVAPELALFESGVGLSSILVKLPEEAYLVQDLERQAWFSLVEGTLIPLDPGTSGLTAATPLSVYQTIVTAEQGTERTADQALDAGVVSGGLILGLVVIVLVVLLLIPTGRRQKPPVVDEPKVAPASSATTPVASKSAKEPAASSSTKKPPTKKVTPTKKPPAKRSPSQSAASTKPANRKPPSKS